MSDFEVSRWGNSSPPVSVLLLPFFQKDVLAHIDQEPFIMFEFVALALALPDGWLYGA